jgi:hypothetical protein
VHSESVESPRFLAVLSLLLTATANHVGALGDFEDAGGKPLSETGTRIRHRILAARPLRFNKRDAPAIKDGTGILTEPLTARATICGIPYMQANQNRSYHHRPVIALSVTLKP